MPDGATTTDKGVSAQRLKSFIERIERLEEERKALGGDLREVYSEAKGGGFDVKIIRQVVKLRKMDKADRQEQEALLNFYLPGGGLCAGAPSHRGQPPPTTEPQSNAAATIAAARPAPPRMSFTRCPSARPMKMRQRQAAATRTDSRILSAAITICLPTV